MSADRGHAWGSLTENFGYKFRYLEFV
jgi:hypothetical protein